MKRYNRTERIGVNAIEQIFLKEFKWVFREQPIVDVGIDALVEESVDDEPKARFIGLQIKCGSGNFRESKDDLVYYISNIHYNYWLSFDIPLLLIAYLPDSEIAYWIEICESNIKKTKRRWKVEIPKKNILNKDSILHITKLLSKKTKVYPSINLFKGDNISEQTVYDYLENVNCITDAKVAIENMGDILTSFKEMTTASTEKFNQYNSISQSFDSPQVKALIKKYSKDLDVFSLRMKNECEIFSETFSVGVFAYERVVAIKYILTSDIIELVEEVKTIKDIPDAVNDSKDGILYLRNSLSKLPNTYNNLKESKEMSLSILDYIVDELEAASSIALKIEKSLSDLANGKID